MGHLCGRRMRAVAVLCALVAGAGVLAGCGSGVRMAEHAEKEYTLSYPASWRRPSTAIEPNARFEVADTPRGKRTPNVTLDVLLYDDPGSLERAARDFVTRSATAPGFRLISRHRSEVSGAPGAYRIRKRYRSASADDGSPLTLEQTDVLTVAASGKRLDVRYICQASLCPRYRESADATLDSLTIR